jgi:hypothetical protein
MDFDDIGQFIDSGGDLLGDVSHLLSGVLKVKSQWRQLRADGPQPGAGAGGWSGDHFPASAGGNVGPPVATEVRQVAAANGNPWVPDTTAGFGGIDLTGVWCPPMNFYDRCAIRQSGPYLNVAALIGGMMTFAGEGLVDPGSRTLAFAGQYANGAPAQVRAQLLPNGVISGMLAVFNPWGVPMTNPLFLQRVQ